LIPRIRGEFASVNSVMGHVVQAFALHGLKLQMYSLEEQLKNYQSKFCFLLQPKFLVLGFSKNTDEGVELKTKQSLST
jgi:hypothetical protein